MFYKDVKRPGTGAHHRCRLASDPRGCQLRSLTFWPNPLSSNYPAGLRTSICRWISYSGVTADSADNLKGGWVNGLVYTSGMRPDHR